MLDHIVVRRAQWAVVRPVVYLKSISAALGASILVLAVSARIEQGRAERFFHSFKPPPIDNGGNGVVFGGEAFGPGLFTLALAVAVFWAVYHLVSRRAKPHDEPQFLSVVPAPSLHGCERGSSEDRSS